MYLKTILPSIKKALTDYLNADQNNVARNEIGQELARMAREDTRINDIIIDVAQSVLISETMDMDIDEAFNSRKQLVSMWCDGEIDDFDNFLCCVESTLGDLGVLKPYTYSTILENYEQIEQRTKMPE